METLNNLSRVYLGCEGDHPGFFFSHNIPSQLTGETHKLSKGRPGYGRYGWGVFDKTLTRDSSGTLPVQGRVTMSFEDNKGLEEALTGTAMPPSNGILVNFHPDSSGQQKTPCHLWRGAPYLEYGQDPKASSYHETFEMPCSIVGTYLQSRLPMTDGSGNTLYDQNGEKLAITECQDDYWAESLPGTAYVHAYFGLPNAAMEALDKSGVGPKKKIKLHCSIDPSSGTTSWSVKGDTEKGSQGC